MELPGRKRGLLMTAVRGSVTQMFNPPPTTNTAPEIMAHWERLGDELRILSPVQDRVYIGFLFSPLPTFLDNILTYISASMATVSWTYCYPHSLSLALL